MADADKSAYELQRDANVAANRAHLATLGLEPLVPPAETQRRAPAQKRQRPVSEDDAATT